MLEKKHYPVMKNEVLHYLDIKEGGIYIDATCGRGGHSRAILEKSDRISLYGLDKDLDAIAEIRKNLSSFSNFKAYHSGFEKMDEPLEEEGICKVDGILMDIGFSTNQITSAERGLSFLMEGPLDMRFDKENSLTAGEIVNSWDRNNLIWIFEQYGEIKNGKKFVQALIERRRKGKFKTTTELAGFISDYFGYRRKIHPATRFFMALRIAVNNELEVLKEGLEKASGVLKKNGRLVVISFHSLEDRIVKRFLKENPEFLTLTKKPVTAGQQELKINPESRSAKLRAAEKI